ncbi:two pore calcium channel protein 1-like isoform X2 [Aethina tumida]|uniref:two pore calcium channel protein 1-like isoform X2 n=1 Tax=Aethina tumida TaxID=116153 RepID=UPI002148749A|nr:two pore calcium channel protein 1-like isoform X2 [Aethina tumida]
MLMVPQNIVADSIILRDPLEEMGSRSSLSRENETEADHWEMNYHEASIFLEEGGNNEKFDSHPRHPSALPPYLLVHNSWYYGLDLTFSIVLILLALVEKPSVENFELPVAVHSTIELVSLGVIAIELALKLRWIGWTTIFNHKRTMIKCITLVIMLVEAITVLIRQSTHFRVTRSLRPIFLVDTRACGSVRRYLRQILQSLPPILDMLILILFIVCCYALLGYFLFGNNPKNLYFQTLGDSFVSMFVLLTTANFPDVMMPSYAKSKWYSIFFISYISIVLYIIMNLMLAVVYETFTAVEKNKFRKLLLHKRQACKLAFRLLVSRQTPDGIKFKQFHGLMKYYCPQSSLRDVVLIFRYLNKSETGYLSEEEFLNVFDAVSLRWYPKDMTDPWFSAAWPPLRALCRTTRVIISWPHFENIIYLLIVCNGVAMLARVLEPTPNLEDKAREFCASWDTFLFLALFFVEALMKIIGLGWAEYISSGWNFFDLSASLLALGGALLILAKPAYTFVVILRPIRLLRVFKLKKRYRDIFGTLVLLSPLMCKTAIVMLVMYYFFAIIGMELFADVPLKNCCVNTTVEDFYHFTQNTTNSGIYYYYLNNFSNLLTSGVTLFELTVVNNWFIIMDAYASEFSPYSRLFFMLFYLLTMVVVTIVVASVLEAFRFRIQYKKQTSKRDEEMMLHEKIILDWHYMQRLIQDAHMLDAARKEFAFVDVCAYIGKRRRTRDVLERHMYATEINQWLEDAKNDDVGHLNALIEEEAQQINVNSEHLRIN